jgi:hypothetical protein
MSDGELLDYLSRQPSIVKAALRIVERHLDQTSTCHCRDTAASLLRSSPEQAAKDVLSRGRYASGGQINEDCIGADDYDQCVEDKRQRQQYWNDMKNQALKTVSDSALEWLAPSSEAAAVGAGEGALGAGALALEEGAGLMGLARFLPMLL